MADFHGHARSNYFRVKDEDKFIQWVESVGDLKVIRDNEGRVGLFSNDQFGGWPDYKHDEDEEIDGPSGIMLLNELASHLQEGSVAVFMEVGAESLRYLTGIACAVNSNGQKVEVSLEDIYERAKSLGDDLTVIGD